MKLRELINLVETACLVEMPALVDTEEDFGLEDDILNSLEYRRFADRDDAQTEKHGTMEFGHIPDHDMGEFFVIDHASETLDFFVLYDVDTYPKLGRAASQTTLWKARKVAFPGVATKVFWMLVKQYGAVVSDYAQTHDGQGFWIKRMAEASQRPGMKVGMLDKQSGVMNILPDDQDLMSWLRETNGWTEDRSGEHIRYFVSRR